MSIESRKKQFSAVFQNWQIRETISASAGGKSALFLISRSDAEESGTVKAVTLIEKKGRFNTLTPQERTDFLSQLRERQNVANRELGRMSGDGQIVRCHDYKFVNWVEADSYGCDVLLRMEPVVDLQSIRSARKVLEEQEIISIGKSIAQVLIRCHDKNTIHGDIKMDNIYRDISGTYKLGDFGLSGTGTEDPREDIYRLGMVLYQLGGGKQNGPLAQIALKACASNPQARYQSAEELLDDLVRLETLGAAAWEPRMPEESEREKPECVTYEVVRQKPAGKKNTGLIAACIALVLAVLCLAAALLWLGSSVKEPEEDDVLRTNGSALIQTPDSAETPRTDSEEPAADNSIPAKEIEGIPAKVPTEAPTEAPAEPDTRSMEQPVIATGQRHTVVMYTDGTAVAAGSNTYGQCDVFGWTDLVAVCAGDQHTVGLRSDGSVVATGQNKYGQCSVSGWTDVVFVSAGDYHTVGLRSDGTLLATGWDTYDQCSTTKLLDAAGGRKIVAVAAGYEHTALLCEDGTVAAVGRNDYGQCNVSSWTDIVAIYAGTEHTVGLRSDGNVVATGRNDEGQCNVSGWSNVTCLTAGDYFVVGLTEDGTLLSTGRDLHGELDLGSWSDVVAVGGGCAHTVAITSNGWILAKGWNENGQCEIAAYNYR